ncbi:dehydrogenase/reductase SDR family member 11-like [Amphiura filiformis]|uniref:dehydrogenase/reductase SDR family member 11-like n=1 Tax=Amphiura filiformis TaxID=82378 RepID=UPI003B217F1D
MFAEIKSKYDGVDICINNAGLAHPATLLEGETQDWRHMININVIGPCVCAREAIKSMKERNVDDGHIINICSLSGHRIQSGSSEIHMYAATKHAVKAITEGLRQELRQMKSNIRVGQISPGDVKTEFVLNMYPDNPTFHEKFVRSGQCDQSWTMFMDQVVK